MSFQISGQSAYSTAYSPRPQLSKEQQAEAAGQLFGQLDSQNKGYLEQSDFSSLLNGLQNKEAKAKTEELFSTLDSDSDGQLTSAEFSDNFSKLLYSAQGMMGAMGPRPPQDSGKSKDELTSMLEGLGQENATATAGLQSLLDNFDVADADGDGKVTMQEAKSFRQSQQTESSSSATKVSGSDQSESISKLLSRTLQQLMDTYGGQAKITAQSGSAVNITA